MDLMLIARKVGVAAIEGRDFFAATRTNFYAVKLHLPPLPPSKIPTKSALGRKLAAAAAKNPRVAQTDPHEKGEE